MGAGQFQTIIANPPQSQWPELRLPNAVVVQRLDGLNAPGLRELYCDSQPLTTLPWNDLKGLTRLSAINCGLTRLDLWRLPSLQTCTASGCANLTQVDTHGNVNLTELTVQFSPQLATINIASCPKLKYIFANGCAFSSTVVTQVLTDLVSGGALGGRLEIAGSGNGAPTNPGGGILKSVLGSKGWTVVTN